MKTKFFKMILPMAAFFVAIIAAFATQNTAVDAFALEQGYINTPAPCQEAKMCSDNSLQPICTYDGQQVFGEVSPNNCTQLLYEPPQ